MAAIMLLQSCGDFMEEYSQDLKRVQSVDDLSELLMGECMLPLSLYESDSYVEISNENFMLLHFMSDELQETLIMDDDVDMAKIREKYFPYFTWQGNCCIDYQGKNSLENDEDDFWNLAYNRINNCNMVIKACDDLEVSHPDDLALKERIKGECYYLRATYYYMLANLYGKPYAPQTAQQTPCVPIKTSANIEDKEYTRNSVAEVYAQIKEDLVQAENILKNAPAPPQTIYHVGIGAVYIFHSRIALYMQDWAEAQRYAELALADNSVLTDVKNLTANTYPMSRDNKEILFSNGASCFGNAIFADPQRENGRYSRYAPTYCVSDNLMELFDDNDARRGSYITKDDDVNYGNWTYHKIDNSMESFGTYKTVSDVFCIRTAEAYLNLAEALAQQGKSTEACRQLEILRANRIWDAEKVSLTDSELITFIREERERELCFEGHRWFDLRRYQVDAKYPFSKEIVHTMTPYKLVGYSRVPSEIRYYRLEPNDEAYTLDIPKTVKDFQPSIGSNPRPERKPFDVVIPDFGDDDDDDDWDDDWDW